MSTAKTFFSVKERIIDFISQSMGHTDTVAIKMHPICSFVDNPYRKAKQALVVASDLTTRVNKQALLKK